MNDLISRQAAIDMLKAAYWDNDIQSAKDDPCIVDAITDWAIRQVKALPSAQRWIPVSERLPKDEERVLVWLDEGEYDDENIRIGHLGYHEIEDNNFKWIGRKVVWYLEEYYCDFEEVVAWMPLPEPYRAADMRGE